MDKRSRRKARLDKKKHLFEKKRRYLSKLPHILISPGYRSMAYHKRVREISREVWMADEFPSRLRMYLELSRDVGPMIACSMLETDYELMQFIYQDWFGNQVWSKDPVFFKNHFPEHFFVAALQDETFRDGWSAVTIGMAGLMDKQRTCNGTTYKQTRHQLVNLDGKDHELIWSQHSIDRIKERFAIRNSYTYAMLMYRPLFKLMETEPIFFRGVWFLRLLAPVAGWMSDSEATIKSFSGNSIQESFGWTKKYLDLLDEDITEYDYAAYLVGYLPLSITEEGALVKTLLLPGYRGAPDQDSLSDESRSLMEGATSADFASGKFWDQIQTLHSSHPQVFRISEKFDCEMGYTEIVDECMDPLFPPSKMR